jgi:DNA-binding CsgD family transcriptional regulator
MLNLQVRLSDREWEIMEQLILGHTKKEVANIFCRSTHTITSTARNVFEKTGARNITELSTWYWCKRMNVAIDFSHPRRKIIPAIMLVIYLMFELSPIGHEALRSTRVRLKETEYRMVRRNDEIC